MSGGQIGVPTTRGPFEWPQDVFGCKRAFFRKCLFSLRKIEVFEGRVALRPPPRAIWTDVRSCYPWETPLPHSTKNKKKHVLSCLFSLLSFLCSLPSALEAARGPTRGRHGQEKGWPPSGGLIWGPLAASFGVSSLFFLLSSLFSPLSSLFALRSSLFSLLSSPCRRGLARPRSLLLPHLSSERVSERSSE